MITKLMNLDAIYEEKITSLENVTVILTTHVDKSISHTFPATCNF